MALNLNTINGKLKPIRNRVIVSNMFFGEQKTASGLIVSDDNGSTRGIYPRWGQIHAIGPENKDDYKIGAWILIEHGRWTRSVKINEGEGEIELRMVEAESILGYSEEKPKQAVTIGKEYNDGDHATIAPEAFGAGA
jgi:co-chaperonin GroES (HSP10)|tara:strand:+ start:5703 stop:6113 length:411 start_codon:yes stop_codon:yes gene_type:complete